MSGFKFGRKREVGKHTLCWGTVSSKTRPPKKRKKRKKRNGKNGKFGKRAQTHHQICLLFQCLGAGGALQKDSAEMKKNSAETMRKLCGGAALSTRFCVERKSPQEYQILKYKLRCSSLMDLVKTPIQPKPSWFCNARLLSCHGLAQTCTWKDMNENIPLVLS